MKPPYRTRRRIEFRDTDAAGIMHFSAYFTYMEEVEHELLRALGTSVVTPFDGEDPARGKISWPRVAAECQYADAARFEEELDIEVDVARVGTSSVTYAFRFLKEGQELARGSLTSVCCRFVPDRPAESIPIPDELRQQLTELQTP